MCSWWSRSAPTQNWTAGTLSRAPGHVWVAGADAGLPALPVSAYARALAGPDGSTRIGRVVTHLSARHRGLGGTLVEHLVHNTDGPWTLDAQARLADWYAGFGFTASGAPFDDWGMPHVPMRRDAPAGPVTAPRPLTIPSP